MNLLLTLPHSAPEFITSISLITRSSCSLIRLSFGPGDSPSTHDQPLNLFVATSMLSELELMWGAAGGVDDVLQMDLQVPSCAVACCPLPRLTSIKLSVHCALSSTQLWNFRSSSVKTPRSILSQNPPCRAMPRIPASSEYQSISHVVACSEFVRASIVIRCQHS